MRDIGGLRGWRSRPLRERLLPWPAYLLVALGSLGCGLYLLSGPDDLSNTALVGCLLLALVLPALYLARLSRRVRR